MNKYIVIGAVAAIALGLFMFTRGGPQHDMANMSNVTTADPAAGTESTKGFQAAMAQMMKGMMVAPTGVPDADFFTGMIPHHEGAVAMAKVQIAFGKDPELLKLANDIVKTQDSEIAIMKAWIAKTNVASLAKSADSDKANQATMTTMMGAMSVPYTGKTDVDFARGMIPHHQGAIDAAKVVLQYGADPEVKSFAETVIKAQSGEIAVMTEWLKKNAP